MDILCKLYQSVDLIAVSPSQILIVWRHVVLHQLTFCLTFENGCPEVEGVACSASEWPAVWYTDCKDKKKEIAFTMQPQLYLNCKITSLFSSSVTDNEKVIKFLFLLYVAVRYILVLVIIFNLCAWSINCEKLISVGSGFSLESPNTLLFQSMESTSSEFEPQWVLQLKSTAGHPVSVCLGKNILLLPIWRFTLKSKKLKYLYPINS